MLQSSHLKGASSRCSIRLIHAAVIDLDRELLPEPNVWSLIGVDLFWPGILEHQQALWEVDVIELHLNLCGSLYWAADQLLITQVTDIPQKDKNKAKRTKLSTRLKDYEKSKPKAYTSLNGPTQKDFAGFALQEMEIHPLMLLIRTLSMNLQAFSPTLHNPSTDHTHVNYVETTLIMVMIVLYGCRLGPHEDYQCQPWHQNYYELNPCYDSNSYGFDQPPQNSIDHQPQSIQEGLNQQRMNDVHHKWDDMIESKNELFQSLGEMLRQREQAANLSTHTLEPSRHFNSIYYDGDDEIISQIPPSIAITPVLPTLEPDDSLSMGDEHLSTIPEKESDEFIKSSVEDLVPIPSESEDTSDNDSECDLPFCDNSVTFSNPLFDANDDFTSSDDESLPEEDVPKENFKIYSNPLFEFDEEYISSNPNFLVTPLSKLNEDECFDPGGDFILEEIELSTSDSIQPGKDSYVSNLDEPALLATPLSDANEDECFDPGGEIDEIDAFLDMDISTDIENGYHDSEGDIIYLESLLVDDTIPNLHPDVFLDHDPKNLKDEPDNEDLKSMVKDCPDYEDCHARGFIHRSFDLQSLAYLFVEIPSGEIKVHVEVLSVLWGNRLLIPDGSIPLSRSNLRDQRDGLEDQGLRSKAKDAPPHT
ncbi:hypothetical protein Tco_0477425 [Tanacetum coccineum]